MVERRRLVPARELRRARRARRAHVAGAWVAWLVMEEPTAIVCSACGHALRVPRPGDRWKDHAGDLHVVEAWSADGFYRAVMYSHTGTRMLHCMHVEAIAMGHWTFVSAK